MYGSVDRKITLAVPGLPRIPSPAATARTVLIHRTLYWLLYDTIKAEVLPLIREELYEHSKNI